MKFHLGADAEIVQKADLERAVVKTQRGGEEELNRAEKAQVRRFLVNDVPAHEVELDEEKDDEEEVEAIRLLLLKATKIAKKHASNFQHDIVE
mmetsp:Transcript_18237/g.26663  ORF Transcript_18237/g.26663 Transcript_18237/m.26663 type:complete len:93 (-) Transcript_18237:1329-1607(-)